jgi:hypothetical protein
VGMRSIPGYSGSPVFAYTPFDEHHHCWSVRRKTAEGGAKPISQITSSGPWLLGLGWRYQAVADCVLKNDGETSTDEGYVVQANSGVMYVTPAWGIAQLLNAKRPRGVTAGVPVIIRKQDR